MGLPLQRVAAVTGRTSDARRRIEDAVAQSSPALLVYFARRVQPSHQAADLLAETLLILWKRAASLPARDEEIRPWMFGIAHNVLLHHQRATGRQRALADRLRSMLDVTSQPGFAGDAVFDELHAALATLDQLDRDIIGLVHWDGFTLAETSRILGLKEGTVRSRYHRARGTLRSRLTTTHIPLETN